VRNEQIIIITCEEQLVELTEAFQKPKLQKYITSPQIATFFSFLKGVSRIISTPEIKPLCRDPKDDYLLALSIASDADYLVTGDKDLLVIQQINHTSIIKYTDLENIINLLTQ